MISLATQDEVEILGQNLDALMQYLKLKFTHIALPDGFKVVVEPDQAWKLNPEWKKLEERDYD